MKLPKFNGEASLRNRSGAPVSETYGGGRISPPAGATVIPQSVLCYESGCYWCDWMGCRRIGPVLGPPD